MIQDHTLWAYGNLNYRLLQKVGWSFHSDAGRKMEHSVSRYLEQTRKIKNMYPPTK